MGVSALIVRVPEAEPYVAHWRERLDPSARAGVPAHITVLHPFMPAEHVLTTVLEQIAHMAASVAPFDFRLSATRRFPGVVCLDPEPASAFVAMTERLAKLFPDYPPYGGVHDTIIPHLTVARASEGELDSIELALKANLLSRPVSCRCAELVLIENSSGLWRVMQTFPLG